MKIVKIFFLFVYLAIGIGIYHAADDIHLKRCPNDPKMETINELVIVTVWPVFIVGALVEVAIIGPNAQLSPCHVQ